MDPPESDKILDSAERHASSSSAHAIPSSRQNPTEAGCDRPLTATQNAPPYCEVADSNLAAVVEAWPKLPEAVRTGIAALVKATLPQAVSGPDA
jgi:hypothetical protein